MKNLIVIIKKINLLVFLIVVLAAILRFNNLASNPPSLTWDEVAWGYNAYSLGVDGKDEFGRKLQYEYLESFGDFKPPVYAYLDILPIKIFGLNEFGVRFPSAFFGILTVLVTYFLIKEIFFNSKLKLKLGKITFGISEMAILILAISPWHINLSRAAFEANITTFFLVTGVWLFIKGVKEKGFYLILSAVFFVLSLYTFNTSRIVAPFLVLILAFSFKDILIKKKKETILAILVGLILVLPTTKFLLSPQASLRFKEVNIFSDLDVIKRTNQEVANDNGVFWSKIIHHRYPTFGVEYIRHYLDNFSPDFLFIKGDGNPRFSTQDVGQMYIFDLPFFILGALLLFKYREGFWWIIPLWLLVGIIPAATARETPHALRIETALPTFQILTAVGFVSFLIWIKNIKLSKYLKLIVVFSIFSFLIFNVIYYLHGYYVHYPREYSSEWQYGYKESVAYAKSVENEYDIINITEEMGRPYIYYLFYMKIDPEFFRQTSIVERDVFGFVHVKGFGKYRFGNKANIEEKEKKVLFIDQPQSVPENAKVLKTFYQLNGDLVLKAYTI